MSLERVHLKRGRRGRWRSRSSGQGLVEFALIVVPFLAILMGIVDLGRGIYMYNGVAQAAREIARAASVHPCANPTPGNCVLGTSPETQAVISTQKNVIPGLSGPGASITIQCTDI